MIPTVHMSVRYSYEPVALTVWSKGRRQTGHWRDEKLHLLNPGQMGFSFESKRNEDRGKRKKSETDRVREIICPFFSPQSLLSLWKHILWRFLLCFLLLHSRCRKTAFKEIKSWKVFADQWKGSLRSKRSVMIRGKTLDSYIEASISKILLCN